MILPYVVGVAFKINFPLANINPESVLLVLHL